MMLNTHTFSSSSIRFVGIFFGFTPPTTPLLYSAAVPFSHAEICLGLRNKEQGRTRTNKERKKVTFGVSSSTQHTAAQQARQARQHGSTFLQYLLYKYPAIRMCRQHGSIASTAARQHSTPHTRVLFFLLYSPRHRHVARREPVHHVRCVGILRL